jgi:hypothetical protein
MKALVIYESLYGNTADVAAAIASGIGPGATAVNTDEATADALANADLVVAGAPLMALRLPTEAMRTSAVEDDRAAPRQADVSHPSLRTWLAGLEPGSAAFAAFETKLRWSPGGATGAIEHGFERAGYRRVARGEKFYVERRYGPLRQGELERAHRWGQEIAANLT